MLIQSLARIFAFTYPTLDGAVVTYDDIREYGINRELVEWALEDSDNTINEAGQAYLENIEKGVFLSKFLSK